MPTAPPLEPSTIETSRPSRRGRPRLQEAGLVVVILLIGLALTWAAPTVRGENGFLRAGNLVPSVFTTMSWIAIMAVGVTVVIIGGGIDISVGSVMGLAALGTAAVLQRYEPDASAWVVLPVGIGVAVGIGLLCGLINGALVVGLRMHPFIVTLATLSIFRGIAINSVQQGSLPYGDRILPEAFTDRFISYTVDWKALQPVPMAIMVVVVLAGWVYLSGMVWGRETYAIGGNEEAARFSGIRVGWVKMRTYLISGVCAGLAGLVSCGFYKSAATNTGLGYELTVVAAAVVGGASLNGGRGTALGAALGTLVMQLIDNGIAILSQVKIGPWVIEVRREQSMIIIGIAIVIAVAVDRFSEYVGQRRLARRSAPLRAFPVSKG